MPESERYGDCTDLFASAVAVSQQGASLHLFLPPEQQPFAGTSIVILISGNQKQKGNDSFLGPLLMVERRGCTFGVRSATWKSESLNLQNSLIPAVKRLQKTSGLWIHSIEYVSAFATVFLFAFRSCISHLIVEIWSFLEVFLGHCLQGSFWLFVGNLFGDDSFCWRRNVLVRISTVSGWIFQMINLDMTWIRFPTIFNLLKFLHH